MDQYELGGLTAAVVTQQENRSSARNEFGRRCADGKVTRAWAAKPSSVGLAHYAARGGQPGVVV